MDKYLKKRKTQFIYLYILVGTIVCLIFVFWGQLYGVISIVTLISIELLLQLLVRKIAVPNGIIALLEIPKISSEIVMKFVNHGFDPELGWVRKANTSKVDNGIPYHIDKLGSRQIPNSDLLPVTIATFGDSYCFCREVPDDQTWQAFITNYTKEKVLNFGVGNYGLDQALLRLKREYLNVNTPLVVLGVVPHTIARILSVWKHYNEYGNTMAFKPSYQYRDNELILLNNFINSPDDFNKIEEFISTVNDNDYFYRNKFVKEAFSFPYIISLLHAPSRMFILLLKLIRSFFSKSKVISDKVDRILVNYIKTEGPRQIAQLFCSNQATTLLSALLNDFVDYANKNSFKPVLLIMPMKDDLLYIQEHGNFYKDFINQIPDDLDVVDMVDKMLEEKDLSSLFNRWHYSPKGNEIVAKELIKELSLRHDEIL